MFFFLKGIKHLVLWRVALLLVFLEVSIYYFSWVEIITVLAKDFWRSLSQNRFGIHTSFEVGPYLVVFTYMNRIAPDDCLLKTNHKEWMRNRLQKCWLEHWPMVGVLVLHPERSGSSDSSSKTYVVHLVLPIAITWREVDEPTLETPFFIQKKTIVRLYTPSMETSFGPCVLAHIGLGWTKQDRFSKTLKLLKNCD